MWKKIFEKKIISKAMKVMIKTKKEKYHSRCRSINWYGGKEDRGRCLNGRKGLD